MLGAASAPTSVIAGLTPASTRPRGCPGSVPETTSDVIALAVLASALTVVGVEPALPEGRVLLCTHRALQRWRCEHSEG